MSAGGKSNKKNEGKATKMRHKSKFSVGELISHAAGYESFKRLYLHFKIYPG
jgi:hypothetical protein